MNLKTNLGILRLLSLLEGISFLLFPITMYLKSANNQPTPNRVLGMVHGGLFIAYTIWLFIVAKDKKWDIKTQALAFIASFIPFGTFVADHKIFKPEQLK